MRDRTLVDEIALYASLNAARLEGLGMVVRISLSPLDWDKTSAHLGLDRLPHAAGELSVWDSGEADLTAAWGRRLDEWDATLAETMQLASTVDVREQLMRLESLVMRDMLESPSWGPPVTSAHFRGQDGRVHWHPPDEVP